MITSSISAPRFWGGKKEHIENAYVALLMLLVTVLYEFLSMQVLPEFTFNIYEFIGTWSGLTTVWLSRTENVLCWPWGVVSALALGYFFSTIGLPGQQWLNWGYFFLIQFWAWYHWVYGGKELTVLPVTTLTLRGRLLAFGAIVLGTVVIYNAIDLLVPGSLHPVLDATVVSSSVIAQYLLGRKNVESWILWLGPVNMLSIALFYTAGAYTVMALYIAFFVHAVFALRTWHKSATHIIH
jgi:nicotinamide mononucleotide transporter